MISHGVTRLIHMLRSCYESSFLRKYDDKPQALQTPAGVMRRIYDPQQSLARSRTLTASEDCPCVCKNRINGRDLIYSDDGQLTGYSSFCLALHEFKNHSVQKSTISQFGNNDAWVIMSYLARR